MVVPSAERGGAGNVGDVLGARACAAARGLAGRCARARPQRPRRRLVRAHTRRQHRHTASLPCVHWYVLLNSV